MLVHFIGGPMHGHTEAATKALDIIKVPKFDPPEAFVIESEDKLPPLERSFETLEYRVTRRTRRYCIAEYIEPKVVARVEVRIEVPLYETKALDILYRWLRDRRMAMGQSGAAKLVGVMAVSTGNVDLQFQTTVDGPADAAAVAEAGENIQTFLDFNLPRVVRKNASITQTGVSVD